MIFKTLKAIFEPEICAKNSKEIEIYTKFLSKMAIFILIFGAVLSGAIWLVAKSSVGQDIAILVLCIAFMLVVGVASIKEILESDLENKGDSHA